MRYFPVVSIWLVFFAAVFLAIQGITGPLAALASIACVLATEEYLCYLRQEGKNDERS